MRALHKIEFKVLFCPECEFFCSFECVHSHVTYVNCSLGHLCNCVPGLCFGNHVGHFVCMRGRGDPRTISSPHPSSIGGSHWLPPFPASCSLARQRTKGRREDEKISPVVRRSVLTTTLSPPLWTPFWGLPDPTNPQPFGDQTEGPRGPETG